MWKLSNLFGKKQNTDTVTIDGSDYSKHRLDPKKDIETLPIYIPDWKPTVAQNTTRDNAVSMAPNFHVKLFMNVFQRTTGNIEALNDHTCLAPMETAKLPHSISETAPGSTNQVDTEVNQYSGDIDAATLEYLQYMGGD